MKILINMFGVIFTILQIVFGVILLANIGGWWPIISLIATYVITAAFGGLIILYADQKVKGDGLIMTAGYLYLVPFASILSLYFIYKYTKEVENGTN